MFFLIIAPSLVSLLLGWDGLGFVSFLLVCWFGSSRSFSASFKTFLVNRLGDSFYLFGLVILFRFGGFNFVNSFVFIIFFSLFTKRALFPFSYWLPEAMAAPTPVSALVHSSTLVTAGLYVIFRYLDCFSFLFLFFLSFIGLFTLYLGSFSAIFTFDSKKIVAYSTLSQLGLLSFILSFGLVDLFYSYLLVHAVFKASLFVSVGSFMVVGRHCQDIRYLSSLWFINPFFSLIMFFSIFSLSGFPFLSCFFFKELVIGSFLKQFSGLIVLFIFFFSLFITVYYSFRLMYLLVFKNYFFLNISFNFFYPLFSSVIFMFFMLFYGLSFTYSFVYWLKLGGSYLFLFGFAFFIFLYFYFSFLFNLSYNFLNVFYSFLSYFYIFFSYIYNILDLNLSVFSFIWYLNNFIWFNFRFYGFSYFIINLFYLVFFSVLVILLIFII